MLSPKQSINSRIYLRTRWVFVAVVIAVSMTSPSLAGSKKGPTPKPDCLVRDQDEVWLVSTRKLGASPNIATVCMSTMDYQRYDPQTGSWIASSRAEFWQSQDPAMRVHVYVHGNRMDPALTKERGLVMYCKLRPGNQCKQRVRHVIWSWPSAIIPGYVKDARVKAERTPAQSHLMACWVACFSKQTQVRMVGWSYGGRIIFGALQLLGGGQLNGSYLAAGYRNKSVPQIKAVLWSPAMPRDWLIPGRMNGRALNAVQHIYVMFNVRDPALMTYRLLIRDGFSRGLGYRGIRRKRRLGSNRGRYTQINVTRELGVTHSWNAYVNSSLINKTRMLVLQ